MSSPEPKTVRYGLYYKAIFQLVESAPDKLLLIYLADEYRKQIKNSLSEQTIFVSQKKISDIMGINRRTVTSSLNKLEQWGLIKIRPNAITFNGDEYVSLIKHFESLEFSQHKTFIHRFRTEGIGALEGNIVKGCRGEMVGLQGSSLVLTPVQKYTDLCKNAQLSATDTQNCAFLQSDVQKCTTMCKNTHTGAKLHRFLKQFAEIVQNCTDKNTFDRVFSTTPCAEMHNEEYEAMKEAFYTGNFPESTQIDQNILCIFAQLAVHFCTTESPKPVQKCTTVINNIDKEKDKPASPSEKGEEDFPLKPLSNVEGFQPSSDSEEFEDSLGIIELVDQKPFGKSSVDYSQLVKNKISNPYKDKPYFSEKEAKKITASLDPALTYDSPVKLFINLFWWGCWDLYVENYDARDYDENGDPIDNEDVNDLKMIDAVLPANDLLKLAEQIYEDIEGAMVKGVYEDAYGKYKLDFNSLDDFQPHFIFDWEEAEINDQPGLKVSLKRFRNIEANIIDKVPVPKTRSEIAAEAKLDRSFTKIIMESQLDSLTPIEQLVRAFYSLFVKFSDDYHPEYFTNTEHEPVEGHSLPGYIYKPQVSYWCNDHDITADELFSTLSQTERQVLGADIKMTRNIFSVRKVHRWNVAHGYESSVAESIISQQS